MGGYRLDTLTSGRPVRDGGGPVERVSAMAVERTAALTDYLRFLVGNPDGDAAARALVLGALTPLSVWSAVIFARSKTGNLEIAGSHGVVDELTGGLRVLPPAMALPVCEAFATAEPIALTAGELLARYPLLMAEPRLHDAGVLPAPDSRVVFAPLQHSGATIGVVGIVQDGSQPWDVLDWRYLDGVLAGVSLWLNNQREVLVDRWRRAAPPPQRDVRVSERQREVLEMVSLDRTNREIARALGYSVPTIKKDLQHLMQLLGTHDRRSTAGRAREIGLLPERRGLAVPPAH